MARLGTRQTALILLGVAVAGLGGYLAWRGLHREGVSVAWRCAPIDGATIECSFESKRGTGSLCMDVVVTCGDGRHQQRICTEELSPGRPQVQRLAAFVPPLAASAACNVEILNKQMK
jgi:hypothetical protein